MIEHKALQIVSTFKQLTNSHMITQTPKTINQPAMMLTFDDF